MATVTFDWPMLGHHNPFLQPKFNPSLKILAEIITEYCGYVHFGVALVDIYSKRKGDGIGCVQVSTEVAQCGFPIGFLLAAVLVYSRGLQLGPDTCSGN